LKNNAEFWARRKVNQKYFDIVLERMGKISCSSSVRYEEIMHRDEEERNVLRKIKKGRLNELVKTCVGNVFGNTSLRERQKSSYGRRRRPKQQLDDLKEMRRHWKW